MTRNGDSEWPVIFHVITVTRVKLRYFKASYFELLVMSKWQTVKVPTTTNVNTRKKSSVFNIKPAYIKVSLIVKVHFCPYRTAGWQMHWSYRQYCSPSCGCLMNNYQMLCLRTGSRYETKTEELVYVVLGGNQSTEARCYLILSLYLSVFVLT